MEKLRVLIVGAGAAARNMHLDAYMAQPGVRVDAVCDVDIERAKALAGEKSVPGVYKTMQEAFNSQKFDIVSVCSPPQFHLEHVRQAMDAGAHVLLEKPIGMSIEEAEEINRCRENSGKKLCVVHNFKFQKTIRDALRLQRKNAIGEILQIDRTYIVDGASDKLIADENSWAHSLKGGRWGETLPHDIYLLYQFVGKMSLVDVRASKRRERFPWLKADEVHVSLKTSSGFASIRLSANADGPKQRNMFIHGSKTALAVDGKNAAFLPLAKAPPRREPGLRAVLSEGKKYVLSKIKNPEKGTGDSNAKPGKPAGKSMSRGHYTLIEGFISNVRGETDELPTSWEEAFHTMELTEETGKAIDAGMKE